MPASKRKGQKRRKYETRITLFLDFLGFREHVARTTTDSEFLQRLVRAMDRIGKLAAEDKEFHESQRVTQFSDSVVVSYRIDEESAVFWLLNQIAFCVIDLVERGFLVRGALTVGELLHTSKYLVGPAMVEAYELESKVAKFPRVLVDEKILAVARSARQEHHGADEEEEYVRAFLRNDEDGFLFLDYVSWNAVVAVIGGDENLYPDYLAQVGNLVREGLRNPCISVKKKALWLHKQYVAAIELVEGLPPQHTYRQNNPEVCAAIEGLPKLTRASEAAAAAVHSAQEGDG